MRLQLPPSACLFLCAALAATQGKLQAQIAHTLPQAIPGSTYSAQLAIPPGLGYPFQQCELLGEVPRWLTIDCDRLQFKGKVPPARDHAPKDYQVTLRIQDRAGNARSFALAMTVSDRPQIVSLEEPNTARTEDSVSAAINPSGDRPRPIVARNTANRTNTVPAIEDPAEIHPQLQSNNSPQRQDPDVTPPDSTHNSPPNDPSPSGLQPSSAAAELSAAAAHLRATSLASPGPSRTSRTRAKLQDGASGTAGDCLEKESDIEGQPAPQERAALNTLFDAVAHETKLGVNPYRSDLPKLQSQAKQASAALKACAVKASKNTDLDTWYEGRAKLWDQLLASMESEKTPVQQGKYKIDETLVKNLQNFAQNPPPAAIAGGTPTDVDLGLMRYYFVGGSLLSQEQSQFSHSDLFLAFHLDRVVRAPSDYLGQLDYSCKKTDSGWTSPEGGDCPKPRLRNFLPGINSTLDIRLTALPVSVQACTPTATKSCANKASSTSGTSDQTQVFLNSQKAARIEGGVYFPYQVRRWKPPSSNDGYTLYLAPIAKVGFDTTANGLNQTQQSSGTPANVQPTGNSDSFYKFYTFGGRLAVYQIAKNHPDDNQAPELIDYLDIGLGRFTNLATLLCPSVNGGPATSQCTASPVLLHQAQYRIAMEGFLQIPGAKGVSIGLGANLAQRGIGAHHYDLLPPDDLRLLFGYKVDLTKFFKPKF